MPTKANLFLLKKGHFVFPIYNILIGKMEPVFGVGAGGEGDYKRRYCRWLTDEREWWYDILNTLNSLVDLQNRADKYCAT